MNVFRVAQLRNSYCINENAIKYVPKIPIKIIIIQYASGVLLGASHVIPIISRFVHHVITVIIYNDLHACHNVLMLCNFQIKLIGFVKIFVQIILKHLISQIQLFRFSGALVNVLMIIFPIITYVYLIALNLHLSTEDIVLIVIQRVMSV